MNENRDDNITKISLQLYKVLILFRVAPFIYISIQVAQFMYISFQMIPFIYLYL